MLIKFIAILIVLLGIAGLILPIVPGLLLITIGVLLFFKDKTGEIKKALPEKIPALAAVIYSWIIPKILYPHYEIIRDEIDLPANGAALDIGTGPGILVVKIAKKFPSTKVIGIDLSEKMIEIANRSKSSIGNVEFRVMDAKRLEFPQGSFDFIISTGSLHHWKEPVKIFDEIYRCLKPGAEAWVYDGYANAKNQDIDRCTRRMFGILPPRGVVRYMMSIHGYTDEEYRTQISSVIASSKFRECILEKRGIMMRIRLKKH